MKAGSPAVIPTFFSAFLLTVSLGGDQPPERTGQRVNADAAALQVFQQRLNTYLRLRTELGDRLEPLASTPSAAELTSRQEALAKALRSARATAKPGDLIPEAAAKLIATTVVDDFKRRRAAGEKAAFSEIRNAPRPLLNQTYPEDAEMATAPPLLLKNLPPLPDNLQYRFYGRHLLLIDGDLQIIADYIANVVPPR